MKIFILIVLSFLIVPFIEYVLVPFVKFTVLDVGKKGFAPILSSIASSFVWMGLGILSVNGASLSPSFAAAVGLSASISDIIPAWVAIPVFVAAFVINAISFKWSQ